MPSIPRPMPILCLLAAPLLPGGPPPPCAQDSSPAARQQTTLADVAESVRARVGVPALAVATIATVEGRRVVESAVVGRRSIEDEQPSVEPDDRFHLGSITKSMTAAMLARLVELGELDWELALGDALAGIDMWPEYAECTLLQLLQHRSGLPAHLHFDDGDFARLNGLPGDATAQREAYVREVLGTEPEHPGGFRYSNAGYAVAGLVAERATGKPWESLVRTHVLDALGLEQAGFGWPATPERPDQPRGHFRGRDGLRPQGLDEYTLGAFMGPAGNVHASVRDLARYAAAHLDGLQGRAGFLAPETVRRLHEPLPGAPYACGWMVSGGVHAHNGSAGTFHALVELVPGEDRAFVLAANASDFQDGLAAALREALEARRAASVAPTTQGK